jgi:hypothetical protein
MNQNNNYIDFGDIKTYHSRPSNKLYQSDDLFICHWCLDASYKFFYLYSVNPSEMGSLINDRLHFHQESDMFGAVEAFVLEVHNDSI